MDYTEVENLNRAVDSLKQRININVNGFMLLNHNPKIIEVQGFSNYRFIENITKKIALQEFNAMKTEFNELSSHASVFLDYIKDKTIVYYLCVDEGNGSILICKEANGRLVVANTLKDD